MKKPTQFYVMRMIDGENLEVDKIKQRYFLTLLTEQDISILLTPEQPSNLCLLILGKNLKNWKFTSIGLSQEYSNVKESWLLLGAREWVKPSLESTFLEA